MKRGLKEPYHVTLPEQFKVTTVTPMKRGLKDKNPPTLLTRSPSYNRYPDEKGTESSSIKASVITSQKMLQPLPR